MLVQAGAAPDLQGLLVRIVRTGAVPMADHPTHEKPAVAGQQDPFLGHRHLGELMVIDVGAIPAVETE